MSDSIRWGILGTGAIAHAFAGALRDSADSTVVAVGSRSLASADAFADRFDIARRYGSYADLASAPDIDVIYIATPASLHAQNTTLALEHGKAVLCEKPFALNARQAEEMVALARKKNLFLMEGMWTRFHPSLAEVKRIIASGQIGTVQHVSASLGFSLSRDPAHRLNDVALGGGALLDLGVYPLSIASALLGPIDDIEGSSVLGESGCDVATCFTMRHANGLLSTAICSTRSWLPCALTVSGALGQIQIDPPFHVSRSLTVREGMSQPQTISTPYEGNGFTHEAMEVNRCLKAGLTESPFMPLGETVHLMRLLDKVRGQTGILYPDD